MGFVLILIATIIAGGTWLVSGVWWIGLVVGLASLAAMFVYMAVQLNKPNG